MTAHAPRRVVSSASALLLLALLVACSPSFGDAGSVSSRPPTDTGGSVASPIPSATGSAVTPQPPASSATPSATPTAVPPTSPVSPAPTPTPTQAPVATPAPATATPVARQIPLTVYFFMPDEDGQPRLAPVQRHVPETVAVARAAVTQLLDGPTAAEAGSGTPITTAIPADTVLLDIAIKEGVATVDLSREFESGGGSASMTGRLAQVVYTVTQFPSVQSVNFRLDGQPVDVFSGEGIVLDGPSRRDHYTEQLPEIFVDSPAVGATIPSSVRVRGSTRVFEATFFAGVYDRNGNELARELVTATCGTGCWGTFDLTLRYDVAARQMGSVVVWNESAHDGSEENVRGYSVVLTP